jgi:hypothetical protein
MTKVRALRPLRLTWPWREHEGCLVYLVRLPAVESSDGTSREGEVCGRICKACNIIETHVAVDPTEGRIDFQLQIDTTPVGSA